MPPLGAPSVSHANFGIGDVVRHRHFSFRGVVFDIDPAYANSDEWYNSIVSDVGIASSRNRFALNQQKDIMTQLTKVRDQISGVSIDEETANENLICFNKL